MFQFACGLFDLQCLLYWKVIFVSVFFYSLRHNVFISLLMRPSPEWFGSLQHPGPHLHLNFMRFSLSPPIRFLFPKALPSYLVCFAFLNNFTSLLLLSLYSCPLSFWIPAFLIVLNPSSPHYCFVVWHWRVFTSPSGSSQCFEDVFSLWGVRLCTVYSLSAEQAHVNCIVIVSRGTCCAEQALQ